MRISYNLLVSWNKKGWNKKLEDVASKGEKLIGKDRWREKQDCNYY